MTIIYAPEQFTAARNVIHTDAILADYLNHEPLDDSARWNRWNDGYQAAFDAYEDAALTYRRLVGSVDPHTVTTTAPSNPLRPGIIPTSAVAQTEDGHFLAGPVSSDQQAGPWVVDIYDPPLTSRDSLLVYMVRVDGRKQAQAMVDLMTWALDTGAQVADQDAA